MNTESWKKSRKSRGIKRKNELIKLCGGKCSNCGYSKCTRALCFHHNNENEKLFTLDQSNLTRYSMEIILTEVNKCILLCQT